MQRKPDVTGKTLIVPLIGHPVAQVKTPGAMNRWFAEHGVDAVVVPMDIRPERVDGFFDVLRATENCVGCSITMPHKQAAFVASDEVTERARRAKAVNTIRRSASGKLIGDMTDGMAMVAALEAHDISIGGRNVLLVGAGGAGTAIAFQLAEKGAASLTVLEVDRMRGRALMAELARHYPDMSAHDRVPAGTTIDIAINASPAGMDAHDPLPYPIDQLLDALIVADAVTEPAVTPWLIAAEKHGLKILRGEEMALAQVHIQLPYLRLMPAPAKSVSQRPAARARPAGQGMAG